MSQETEGTVNNCLHCVLDESGLTSLELTSSNNFSRNYNKETILSFLTLGFGIIRVKK